MRKLIFACGGSREALTAVKNAGWDGVFTTWHDDESQRRIAKDVKEFGLIYQSVHAPFNHVDRIWEDPGEGGEAEVNMLCDCLHSVAGVGVDLVIMHAIIGMERCTPTELGVERFGKIYDCAKECGIRVAMENTEGEVYLEKLLTAYKDLTHVGFCIDTGHEMCYNYSRDLIRKYGKNGKLFGTHLNDNMGITGEKITWLDDSHMLPFDGVADWEGIAERLHDVDFRGMLTFELAKGNRPGRHTSDAYEAMTYEEYVKEAWRRAVRFGELMGD